MYEIRSLTVKTDFEVKYDLPSVLSKNVSLQCTSVMFWWRYS